MGVQQNRHNYEGDLMKISRQEAEQRICESYDRLLVPAKRSGYICPVCQNGSGEDGTGLIPKIINGRPMFHCFKCPSGETKGDVINLLAIAEGVNYNQEAQKLIKDFGFEIDDSIPFIRREEASKPAEEIPAAKADFTKLYQEARKPEHKQKAAEYLAKRGINSDLMDNFHIGWNDGYLIIPITNSFYIARDTLGRSPKYKNPSREQGAKVYLFNAEALWEGDSKTVFILEGAINALSVIQAGGNALALNSVSNTGLLIDALKEYPTNKTLVLCLDNDEAGQRATLKLEDELKGLSVPYLIKNISGDYNDANEALIHSKDMLRQNVKDAERSILKPYSAAGRLDGFVQAIRNSERQKAIKTGFRRFDDIIGGGLYPGLYSIGAVSSLGKTTFALQMADSIAASGTDVYIFSLEMAYNELIAKSISRLTYYESIKRRRPELAKGTRQILTGSFYKAYSEDEREIIRECIRKYESQIAENVQIFEGATDGKGEVKIETIKEVLKAHIDRTGKRPVAIIDYLQIIALSDERQTDKRNIDKAVVKLKQLSRDLEIPVIVISSFNRESYMNPVSMSNFKESGAIEYTSDVLIGLQYDGMDYQEGETEKARDKRIRDLIKRNEADANKGEAQVIQLKVLKNRNGKKGDCRFNFIARYNVYYDYVEFKGGVW